MEPKPLLDITSLPGQYNALGCDYCDTVVNRRPMSAANIRAHFARLGWIRHESHDVCPSCKILLELI